ncbi:MAG: hypothetical protein IJA12_02005 [Oscillospiraceae bacterium]|nr:hypothetical protein [Oscillospiraceae bacterium]
MKAVTGYTEAKATSFNSPERLPAGGYVLRVLDVKEENNGYGDVVVLRFDITEGEFKGFFDNQYRNMPDEYKKWKGTYRLKIPFQNGNSEDDVKKYNRSVSFFKSQIEAVNKSNNISIDCSKEWDTAVLKNRLVGAVFGNKEWKIDGKTGWFTNCDHLVDAKDIRDGNFKIPKDKPLDSKASENTSQSDFSTDTSDFDEIETESPVPF